MTMIKLVWPFLLASSVALGGSVPAFINYQGTLKDGNLPAKGSYKMTFRLTDNQGNQKGAVINLPSVPVNNGLFAVQLDFTANGTMPVDWQSFKPYIQVSINDQALSPSEPVSATAYSYMSQSVVDGAVTRGKLDSSVQTFLTPPGAILAYAGATPPQGWLLCDGSAVSRSTYADLFQAIKTAWGGGDGSSTFNLPDLRGRAPIGAGQGPSLTNRTLGQTLGEEAHTLTIAEMPAHNHPVNDPGHYHESATGGFGPFGNGPVRNNTQGGTGLYTVNTALTSSASTGISVLNVGGGSAHNNMPPSAAVSYIIKY